jgi:hypothetical protein
MTRLLASFALLLLVLGCAPASGNNIAVWQPADAQLRITIDARNNRLLGEYVELTFFNRESFPVCFSSADLLPGLGMTFVRDPSGQILNGSVNTALEEYRGINLASPLVVLRPGRAHPELMNLAEYRPGSTPLLLQIGIQAFRCSDLFDGAEAAIHSTVIQKVVRFAGGRITNEPDMRFEIGEEPPPAPPESSSR